VSGFVLDASTALSWCFKDERTARDLATLERLERAHAVVPAIWPLEMANALARAERQWRVNAGDIDDILPFLAQLNIGIESDTPQRGLTDIFALARRERLSAYDAAYLDLAMRRRLPLASRDRGLLAAAGRCGVERLPV
jgi:predicted nucleic acid-binding protein